MTFFKFLIIICWFPICHSVAASVLCNVLIEKRHEENMATLEKEIKTELEKNRRDLDAILEKKLVKELQVSYSTCSAKY